MNGPRLHFISGKGGVGKSTFALALSEKLAGEGRKTLLVDLADSELFKQAFELKELTYRPQKVGNQLYISYWRGQDCLREYIKYFIKIEALTALFFENPVSRALVKVAPGLKELAILGKATSAHRLHGPKFEYDDVVIDAYATGHFLALLRAPSGMARAISKGPMGDQSRRIDQVLRDPKITNYYIVTLAEALPMKEAMDLHKVLKNEFGANAEFVLNKFISSPFSSKDFAKLDKEKDEKSFIHIFNNKLHQQEESTADLRKYADKVLTVRFRPEPISSNWAADLEELNGL